MIAPYDPPLDQAHSILYLSYAKPGSYGHRMRVHLAGAITTPTGANNDYNYTVSGSGESSVIGTFTALANLLKPFWPSTWSIAIAALYKVDSSGNAAEVFPTPTPAAVAGTSVMSPTDSKFPFGECIINMHTLNGNKAKMFLIGSSFYDVNAPTPLNDNGTASSTAMNLLVAYLIGSSTMLVGHDGSKLLAPAHITFAANKRLRRRYNFA